MSILDAYEPGGEPIIVPGSFYPKLEPRTDTAVACFSIHAFQYVLDRYPHELYCRFRITANGVADFYYLPEQNVLFYMSPIGASVAGAVLQEVAYFAGITKFVYFGSCGVLDPSLKGKFIAPTECYREEGYSYHYASPSDYIAIKNHEAVASFLRAQGASCVQGRGWTTDAIYNETKAKYGKRKSEGVIAVDMESAGLQAIADHLGVELYTFYFSGDILGSTWTRGDLGGVEEKQRQSAAVEIALLLGKSLAG